MTLKAIIDNLDDVEESQRGLYTKQADGTFRLDVEGVEFPSDVEGLKRTLDTYKAETRKLKASLKAFEGIDPDEVRELLADREKGAADDAKARGDWEAREKQLIDKHRQEQEKLQTAIAALEGFRDRALIDSAARVALEKHGGSSALLLPHVKSRLRVVADGDDFTTQVVDANGHPQVADAQGNPLTIDGLVAQMKEDQAYAPAFASSGKSGGGSAGGGQQGGSNGRPTPTGKIGWHDREGFSQNLEDIAAGKVAVESPPELE